MFNYAGAFVGICIVRPGDFVYLRLIMLVHLLGGVRRICLHTLDYAGAFVGEARRLFFLPLQQSSGDHDGRALTKTTDAITT